MRNEKRSSWAHDLVRMTAVAPVPRQYNKLSRPRHSDEPLSDSGGEEPRKVRSYIKPNKNVTTYKEAMREQRMVERLMNCQRPIFGPSKRPPSALKPALPIRQELRDTNSRNPEKFLSKEPTNIRNFHPTSVPTIPKVKHLDGPTISPPIHLKKQRSNLPTTSFHPTVKESAAPYSGKTLFARKSTEELHGSTKLRLGAEKLSFKRHGIPKPPPLPKKRQQAPCSSKVDHPVHQQESKEVPPPAKKQREEARTSSPSCAVVPHGLESKTSPTADAALNETVKESWYVEEFEGNASEDKTVGRKLSADPVVAERNNMNCVFSQESVSGKNEREACEIPVLVGSSLVSHEQRNSPDQFKLKKRFGSDLCEEEIRNTPRRSSCLSTVKKQAKKRISFSEELVSTFYYESDSHFVWQEDHSSAVVTDEESEHRGQMLQKNVEHDSMRMDVFDRREQITSKGDDAPDGHQRHFPTSLIVKQEVIDDDDDEIEILFSGKTKYIEELRNKFGSA